MRHSPIRSSTATLAMALWASALPPHTTHAKVYEFEMVTNDGFWDGQFADFYSAPVIDNAGNIVFTASQGPGYDTGVWRHDGSTVTHLGSNDSDATNSYLNWDPAISGNGNIAFGNIYSAPFREEVRRIINGNESTTASGNIGGPFAINDSGQVVYTLQTTYLEEIDGKTFGRTKRDVMVNNQTRFTAGYGETYDVIGLGDLNNAGTIAFLARNDATNRYSLIRQEAGGPNVTLAEEGAGGFTDLGFDLAINNSGDVLFTGTQGTYLDTVRGVYLADGDTITTLADSTETSEIGRFYTFRNAALNNTGGFAFEANFVTGHTEQGPITIDGLFTGSHPVFDKVIMHGDTIQFANPIQINYQGDTTDQATVLGIEFLRDGLNDHGQLAFAAELDENGDGQADRIGIFRAVDATPAGTITAGTSSTASVAGGASTAGGIEVLFDDVTIGGSLRADYRAISGNESEAFANGFGTAPIGGFGFQAGDSVQAWELEFDGDFTGNATVTFAYDPNLLPTNWTEENLILWHRLASGDWEQVDATVDTENHLIVGQVTSFSPFVLGVIPEPATLTLLGLGGLAMLGRRRS